MADQGDQSREELELKSAWIFIDDDGSDASEEAEEAEEDGQTDEADDESGEENDEDGDAGQDQEDSGDHNEGISDAEEEQNATEENKKKKDKVARAVKGLKKMICGGFLPSASGSKLKLDVDFNVNLKATYGKGQSTRNKGKKNSPSKKQPKYQRTKPDTVTVTKRSPNGRLAATRQIAAPPKKAPDTRDKIKQKKDDPSKRSTMQTSGLEGSSSSSADVKIAKLIAENERLRQNNQLLMNTNENLSRIRRSVGCWKFFSNQLRKITSKYD